MKVFYVLPRRMRFEARQASSVELCVSEWASGSRYRATTTISAERSTETPLVDIDIFRLAPARRLTALDLAWQLRRIKERPDVIVVQQHIPTAALIALVNRDVPVVLQTHNYIDPPLKGRRSAWKNWLRERQLSALSGITLISNAVFEQFKIDWPRVRVQLAVVTNGFDFSKWSPAGTREKTIIVVGRAQREKGIVEATQGMCRFLARRPDWQAKLILSSASADPPYFEEISAAAAKGGDRCSILTNVPYSTVRETTEKASIAVVASQWNEPFGRTALEAHAGGVALISSGTGGLRQISGDCALYLDRVGPDEIDRALEQLASDEGLRAGLAQSGAERVRGLFSLERTPEVDAVGEATVCERLDRFLAEVVGQTPSQSAPRRVSLIEAGDSGNA